MLSENCYLSCELCVRRCGVNRLIGEKGFCKCDSIVRVAHADLHFWEEPVISGSQGSGAIFFGGCSGGCVFCQNKDISRSCVGKASGAYGIADMMLSLSSRGAHNINFVTPTHFAPTVADAVAVARARGLNIPIVYNTGSFDTVETVRGLQDVVDVYLPDYKYYKPKTAESYSGVRDYPELAAEAITEMVRQQPSPVIENGIMLRGVIVRVLLLPGHIAEAKLSVKKLYREFGDKIYFSIMCQYTPVVDLPTPLNRTVTRAEYTELLEYVQTLGITQGFSQEPTSADTGYIPKFNLI